MTTVTIVKPQKQLPRPLANFISTRFRVGRFKVEMHMMLDIPDGGQGQQNVYWTSHEPQKGDITLSDLRQIDNGRGLMSRDDS